MDTTTSLGILILIAICLIRFYSIDMMLRKILEAIEKKQHE